MIHLSFRQTRRMFQHLIGTIVHHGETIRQQKLIKISLSSKNLSLNLSVAILTKIHGVQVISHGTQTSPTPLSKERSVMTTTKRSQTMIGIRMLAGAMTTQTTSLEAKRSRK